MPATNAALSARQVQMNTRIDVEPKAAGDAARVHLGYTPSAVVRGLWQFVVDRQDDAAAVREVIDPDAASALSDEASRKVAAIDGLQSLYEQTPCELGILDKAEVELPSWDDLREDWYDERLEREA